jgi:glycosyltransferase involved in cell wall biosynthesis
MATYNPPAELFARQIQSIIDQSYSRWLCVISDDASGADALERMREIISRDERFTLFPSQSRLGFYRNFERSLRLAPQEAQLIALSDHDDRWHKDKLETLISNLKDGAMLVYSDMNIVDVDGNLLASTYWTTRPNNNTNFASLIMANTVTGAASMFRRELLSYALPFPERIGEAYHDHWIACVALALGEIAYVDRPLYDYVQHQNNVIGHFAPARKSFAKKSLRLLTHPGGAREAIAKNLGQWRAIYFHDLMRLKMLARVIELRCTDRLSGEKRKILRRIARLDESLVAESWLAMRSLKNWGRTSETIGAENSLLRALVWRRYASVRSWLPIGGFTSRSHATNHQPQAGAAPPRQSAETSRLERVEIIEQKIAPLSLDVSPSAPRRVNLLIPTIDLKYFFGGYITKLNLARHLSQWGFRVRIIIVDHCDYAPSAWKQQLRAFDGLDHLLDRVETAYCFDRSRPLEVSAQDSFIATTWWTAHIAHRAAKDLKRDKFIYLIQEYEPFTFEMGSFAALAGQTYGFPHSAIFSTELLREYFRENRLGVFAGGLAAGERDSISFQNTITSVGEIRTEDIASRSVKKLLMYARPEAHAARNMFEIAVLALSSAIRQGCFTGDWEFRGIGTVEASSRIKLADGVSLNLLPRQSQETYKEVLRSHDLGLSLMYTPHPSLVPIEMAAAGMLVVTNTCANKTGEKLRAISSNIIAVEPTIEAITDGLKEAAANIEDYGRRIEGSRVEWARTWDQAFGGDVMAKIKEFIQSI